MEQEKTNKEQSSILVVDDEESLREICTDALEDSGYQVFQASDGQHALQVLHNQDSNIDLVISDLRMPEMSGMELLQTISQEKLDVDFLIMTGFGTIETAVESMKMGAADYLPKPFNINHLLVKVEKVLKERKQRAERENLSNLVRVLKLSKDLNTRLEMSSLINEFIFHLERNFNPDSVGLFLSQEGESNLQLASVRGKLLRSDARVLSWVRRICDITLQNKDPKLADPYVINADPDLEFLTGQESFNFSIMAAPMFSKQQTIGVVVLVREVNNNMYSFNDLQLLTVFSSQTAPSIENARLYGKMRDMNMEIIRSYSQAVEAKDIYTRGHSERVAFYATRLGQKLSLSQTELDQLHTAGIVHDIGKIGIPDNILNKPSGLTDKEFEVMKKHPAVGKTILSQVGSLQDILGIIYHHHERVDGKGYPVGLVQEQTPFLARLVSVVDSYEAMTSDRAYRKAMPQEKVLKILSEGAGTQWDAELIDNWMEVLNTERFAKERAYMLNEG